MPGRRFTHSGILPDCRNFRRERASLPGCPKAGYRCLVRSKGTPRESVRRAQRARPSGTASSFISPTSVTGQDFPARLLEAPSFFLAARWQLAVISRASRASGTLNERSSGTGKAAWEDSSSLFLRSPLGSRSCATRIEKRHGLHTWYRVIWVHGSRIFERYSFYTYVRFKACPQAVVV